MSCSGADVSSERFQNTHEWEECDGRSRPWKFVDYKRCSSLGPGLQSKFFPRANSSFACLPGGLFPCIPWWLLKLGTKVSPKCPPSPTPQPQSLVTASSLSLLLPLGLPPWTPDEPPPTQSGSNLRPAGFFLTWGHFSPTCGGSSAPSPKDKKPIVLGKIREALRTHFVHQP